MMIMFEDDRALSYFLTSSEIDVTTAEAAMTATTVLIGSIALHYQSAFQVYSPEPSRILEARSPNDIKESEEDR